MQNFKKGLVSFLLGLALLMVVPYIVPNLAWYSPLGLIMLLLLIGGPLYFWVFRPIRSRIK